MPPPGAPPSAVPTWETLSPDFPERIMIYGVTGSGKSTLCRDLGEKTGLPWHWVDELMWEPGWIQPPVEVQRERIARICGDRRWIIDSAYATWIDIPLESVQLIICLDYPRWISFTRLLRRTLSRAVKRPRVCNGNVETIRRMLSRDSILIWHFNSFKRKRTRMRGWASRSRPSAEEIQNSEVNVEHGEQPPFQVLVFRSPRQTKKWLAELAG